MSTTVNLGNNPTCHPVQSWAVSWSLGCVNSCPAAIGSQDAGITQPRAHIIPYLSVCVTGWWSQYTILTVLYYMVTHQVVPQVLVTSIQKLYLHICYKNATFAVMSLKHGEHFDVSPCIPTLFWTKMLSGEVARRPHVYGHRWGRGG